MRLQKLVGPVVLSLALGACQQTAQDKPCLPTPATPSAEISAAPAATVGPTQLPSAREIGMVSSGVTKPLDVKVVEAELVAKYGEAQRARIKQGLAQVAARWRVDDGDPTSFVQEHFLADPAAIDATFARLERMMEQLEGHLHEMGMELRWATDIDSGPLLGVDPLLAAYEPAANLYDDLYRNKVAFVALLNFPLSDLATKTAEGATWSRRRWAEERLTGRFALRIPASVQQDIAKTQTEGDLYIAEYNIWMHHLVNDKGERLFPKGLRLISHWNLRDELKGNYDDPRGLEKQRLIVQVMERIVTQTIPAAVIDDPRVDWNPFTNEVHVCPEAEVEATAPKRPLHPFDNTPEQDVRYQKLLASFRASVLADQYSPGADTAIKRRFDIARELSEDRVRGLLLEVLSSKAVPKVAAEIEKKLGRKLGPQDLWYAGFKSRAGLKESELDKVTRKKYPDAKAFAADIPRILQDLGFPKNRAAHVAEYITVDPSRGAGHAMEPHKRGSKARLRTRIEKDGMNYKGYNIAVHELGHNVEQVFSLYDVDYTLLAGVPNNAFTEAMAFTFQANDLALLKLGKPSADEERIHALGTFWSTWEIAGVALVETDVWHWLYDHPKATATELREATVAISKKYWNQYYAPVLGAPDSALLGIYSHMIGIPLYLPDYPIGHLIAFQIEEHVRKSGKLGPDFERMAKMGCVLPDLWMKNATGQPISAEPLLQGVERALATTKP